VQGRVSKKGWVFETQPHLSPIPRFGYKFWVTENIGNLGKSREAVTLKRGSCTDMPHSKARDFYPKLAKVGKGIFKEQAWLGYAVTHRFVQCWVLKDPATPTTARGWFANMRLLAAFCLVMQRQPSSVSGVTML
jgi:hypothetical protein